MSFLGPRIMAYRSMVQIRDTVVPLCHRIAGSRNSPLQVRSIVQDFGANDFVEPAVPPKPVS